TPHSPGAPRSGAPWVRKSRSAPWVWARMTMMKISFGSWAFTRGPFAGSPVTFHRLLHKLEDEGYRGVELGAVAPHPTPDAHDTPEKRAHVRAEVADHNPASSGLAPHLRRHTLGRSDEGGLYRAAFER